MFNISQFLEKLSRNVNSAEIFKKQILEIVKEKSGIDIHPDNAEIKNFTLCVKASPAVKNKLAICKEAILKNIASLPIKIIDIK